MRYKNISIAKISDHGGSSNSPTHMLVVSDAKFEHKKTAGKLWTKDGQYGKFLSGKMADKYSFEKNGETVTLEGYCIVAEDYLDKLENTASVKTNYPIDSKELPF